MVPYYGDYPEDHAEIRIPFNTFSSDDPSASVTITDLADADIEVHADGDTTQIATDGASVIINFAGETGSHMILIDSSVDAAYTTGTEYAVKIVGTTIDGGTVNAWVGSFSIERAGGALALIKLIPTAAQNRAEMDSNSAQLAALITFTDAFVLTTATIETVTNQTNFIIPDTADATDDNAYQGAIAVFIDGTDPNQKSFRAVVAYTASTRSIEVGSAPDFTVTTSDTITILAACTPWAVWEEILTGATHGNATTAGRRLRTLQDFGQYEGGLIWVDTVSGTAGTTDGENGTVRLPVRDEADMDSLLGTTGLPGVHIVPGSAIVLESAFETLEMMGIGYTLALAGFSIDDSHIFRARVSGVSLAATRCGFHDCAFNTASVQKARFTNCGFDGTVTFTLAGDYDIVDCHSDVAGASRPTFAKTSGQAITAQFRNWQGGINLSGIEVDDTLTIGGRLGTVNLGSPSGAAVIEIRGSYKEITNVGSAVVNTDGAQRGVDLASALADTNELQTDWTNDGRLDNLLDAIPTTAMRGTDSVVLAGPTKAEMDIAHALLATPANVLTQTNAALDTAISELGVAAPTATPTLRTAIMLLYMVLRNKFVVQTSGTDALEVYNDSGTKIAKKLLADDGSDYTEDEMTSG